MAVVVEYGKSCGNGRTFIGAEVHLCISSSLTKTHGSSPQQSGSYTGAWNHLERLRDLGGMSLEPT